MSKRSFLAVVAVGILAGSVEANTLPLTLDRDPSNPNAVVPNGVKLEATFQDTSAAGVVQATLVVPNNLSPADEFVNFWYFNITDAYLASGKGLSIGNVKLNGVSYANMSWGVDKDSVPDDFNNDIGSYDLSLSFLTTNKRMFDENDVLTFDITGTGLVADDFGALSVMHNTTKQGYLSAAQVQALVGGQRTTLVSVLSGGSSDPTTGSDSGDPVPDGGSALGLLGLTMMAVSCFGKKFGIRS